MRFLISLLLPLVAAATRTFNQTDPFRGVSFYGLETPYGVQDGTNGFSCTWEHDIGFYVQKAASLGFNSLRIPFSYDYVVKGNWRNLDILFDEILKTNMSVVLDLHRISSTHQSAMPWIEGEVTFDQVLGAWDTILKRYGNHPRLVALDVFNEPQSSTDYSTWNSISRQMVQFIDQKYGQYQYLYFVEGIGWGGDISYINLEGNKWSERIRYVIHKYSFQALAQKQTFEEQWDYSFNLHDHPAEKIIVGEWGFISERPDQVEWASKFIEWLKLKGIKNSFFWCLTHLSYDTGGILLDCGGAVDCRKMKMLKHLWFD
jgi:aryl-phospho-beta-D-glucosidase BglC (GH1 family)